MDWFRRIPPEQRRWKYTLTERIVEDVEIDEPFVRPLMQLDTGGILTIQPGYSWDGMSGPGLDTRNALRGSAVHDALYQAIREGLISPKWRRQADSVFRRINLREGMHSVRAWWCWTAVRVFGGIWNRRDRAKE